MTKNLTLLLLLAMPASGTGVFGQAPAASTTLSVRGTIDKYDASGRTLSLSTSNGMVQFAVAPCRAVFDERRLIGRRFGISIHDVMDSIRNVREKFSDIDRFRRLRQNHLPRQRRALRGDRRYRNITVLF